ncbi:O-antigen polymerase [Bifidobacterium scaligerum]|uniref:Oligosaccharide repeat unit polymerase n=1 Tax=Bifidobacterium scaligerum TaxID=2052656 RepID=A0A2M9HPC0_9BIFI|nr:O-antigen polymerase [Bifidobacterium scaligerum]PJM78660.1 hypothetical protein CUU80_07925 [Bifidobacterium scaligerum]
MNTLFLLIILIACLGVSFVLTGRRLISPVVFFFVPFIFQILDGFLFYRIWEFNLHMETVAIVSGCFFVFAFGCVLVHHTLGSNNKIRYVSDRPVALSSANAYNRPIHIPTRFYWLIIIVQIILFLIVFRAEKQVVSQYLPVSGIADVITGYNNLNKFTDADAILPTIPAQLSAVLQGLTFFVALLGAKELANRGRSSSPVCMLALLVAIVVAFATGNRTWPLSVLFTFGIIYLLLLEKQGKITSIAKIKVKYIVFGIIAFVALLGAFYMLTFAMGRDNTMTPIYYLSVYLGAPLKNLDSAIAESITPSPVPGEYTFNFLFQTLIAKFGVEADQIVSLPYRDIGIYPLGNVYTVFFAPLKDFGIAGCLLLIFVLAIVMQAIYEISLRADDSRLSIAQVLYGYFSFLLAMTFFAHFIFQNVVHLGFAKQLVTIIAFTIFTNYIVRKRVVSEVIPIRVN